MHTWMIMKIIITTIVLDAPSIDTIPVYSHETGYLVGIKTIFMELVSKYPAACMAQMSYVQN